MVFPASEIGAAAQFEVRVAGARRPVRLSLLFFPRPKLGQWPSSKSGKKSPQSRDTKVVHPYFPPRQPSRPPEQVVAEANEEVLKLEAAVRALGGESSVHAKPLVEALKAARAKSRVLPVSERLIAYRNFLERARKRVARAEELIAKVTEQKSAFVLEVQEAEERVQQLEAEAAKPTPPSVPTVTELQRRIEELVRERDGSLFRCRERGPEMTPPSIDAIPPMPSSNLQELQGWLSDRNCELRNALEFGDNTTIAKVGALVGQGTATLSSVAAAGTVDGPSRSILMAAAIDQADAKRRCLAAGSELVLPSMSGNCV